jgi:hypothetical protein
VPLRVCAGTVDLGRSRGAHAFPGFSTAMKGQLAGTCGGAAVIGTRIERFGSLGYPARIHQRPQRGPWRLNWALGAARVALKRSGLVGGL